MAKNEQRTQKNALGGFQKEKYLTNCSLQESHAVDCRLGRVEDLKTKQNILTTLSSFNFIGHWNLRSPKVNHTPDAKFLSTFLPNLCLNTFRDRECLLRKPIPLPAVLTVPELLLRAQLLRAPWILHLYILWCQITLQLCPYQGLLLWAKPLPVQ